ncbi:MAG: ribose-phosphate diphosphokinase [Acidimicrobiales bacterium]
MELFTKKTLRLYTGSAHPDLAEEIARHLGVALGEPNIRRFPNGEIHCRFAESVRGTDVFIIQSHTQAGADSVNDALMEQLVMIDAAKRASAKRITAVSPLFGYSRQDRKAEGREPITAKLVADLLTAAGASRMVSVDLHSGQIQGFFDKPVDHLTAMPVLLEYCRRECPDDAVIVAPDAGRVKVAERFAQHLGADLAFVHKRRVTGAATKVEARGVIGDVQGRRCVIIDDRIDTAGTIVAASELLVDQGATAVWAMATHGVLADPAIDRLKNAPIARVVVTDTVPLPPEKQIDLIEVLSIASIVADAIDAVFEDTSVSEIFGGENLA